MTQKKVKMIAIIVVAILLVTAVICLLWPKKQVATPAPAEVTTQETVTLTDEERNEISTLVSKWNEIVETHKDVKLESLEVTDVLKTNNTYMVEMVEYLEKLWGVVNAEGLTITERVSQLTAVMDFSCKIHHHDEVAVEEKIEEVATVAKTVAKPSKSTVTYTATTSTSTSTQKPAQAPAVQTPATQAPTEAPKVEKPVATPEAPVATPAPVVQEQRPVHNVTTTDGQWISDSGNRNNTTWEVDVVSEQSSSRSSSRSTSTSSSSDERPVHNVSNSSSSVSSSASSSSDERPVHGTSATTSSNDDSRPSRTESSSEGGWIDAR